jgi:hypothetical protein
MFHGRVVSDSDVITQLGIPVVVPDIVRMAVRSTTGDWRKGLDAVWVSGKLQRNGNCYTLLRCVRFSTHHWDCSGHVHNVVGTLL